MIYTTYFAKLNKLPPTIVPISICSKSPSYYNGLEYKKLAPKYDFLVKYKKDGNKEYYTKCFNEQILSSLNPYTIFMELKALAGDKKIALVCYERSSDFCHRHLVAEWFKQYGIECEEYIC